VTALAIERAGSYLEDVSLLLRRRQIALRFLGKQHVLSRTEAGLLVEVLLRRTPVVDAETAIAAMRVKEAVTGSRRSVVLRAADAVRIVHELDRAEHAGPLTPELHELHVFLQDELAQF
jgi:hypothetical protein